MTIVNTAMPATLRASRPARATCHASLAVTTMKKAKLASSGIPPPRAARCSRFQSRHHQAAWLGTGIRAAGRTPSTQFQSEDSVGQK